MSGSLVFLSLKAQEQLPLTSTGHQFAELRVDSSLLISNSKPLHEGKHGGFILVEFGDYECPPCRRSHDRVLEYIARYGDILSVYFRNLPLRDLHPHAEEAAIASLVFSELGHFPKVHDALMKGFVDHDAINDLRKLLGTKQSQFDQMLQPAMKRLEYDELLARRIAINSTPTFVVCKPDGKVIRLNSLDELPFLLDSA